MQLLSNNIPPDGKRTKFSCFDVNYESVSQDSLFCAFQCTSSKSALLCPWTVRGCYCLFVFSDDKFSQKISPKLTGMKIFNSRATEQKQI